MQILIPAFFIGAVAALLGALLGVGGGIIMVPAFKALGLTMREAISTSLAVMVVTSAVSSFKYAQSGWVNWSVAGTAAAAAVIAALVGTELMKSLSAQQLKTTFGVFLIAVGAFMLISGRVGSS
jgi:uncharacterized membrane protein YfcA